MDLCTPFPDRRFHSSKLLSQEGHSNDCSERSPLLPGQQGGSGPRPVRGGSAGHEAKGHIDAVPRAGRPRPCHPPRPSEERRRWWAKQEEAAASELRGDRVPETLARQHGRNLGSSRAGPGQPPHSARPGPGCTGRPCRHSAAPARARPNVKEPAGARQCCHTKGDAAAERPGPPERPPDSPAPPARPGSPWPPPSRQRQPRP